MFDGMGSLTSHVQNGSFDGMRMLLVLWSIGSSLPALFAAPQMPTAIGTTWHYDMVQEVGKGVHLSDLTPGPDGKVHLPGTYFIAGEEKIGSTAALRFEMHRAGVLASVDFLSIDEHGIICPAREVEGGEMIKLDPPQKMLQAPVHVGDTWSYDGQIADMTVHQNYRVVAEGEVVVPAGKFHGFHVHGEQTAGGPAIEFDRWFVPGVGWVKDTTLVKFPTGELLERIALELTELPKIEPRPGVKPPAPVKKLTAGLASELTGEATTTFKSDLKKIFARWQGNGLPKKAKIRAVWIAEDVGAVAPPNYKIDESSMISKGPDSFGTFTISRPTKGWPLGKYHVGFYVGEELVETIPFTIEK